MMVLILSSAGAIGILWLLMHRLGFTKTAKLTGPEEAKALFSSQFPDCTPGFVTLTKNGESACVGMPNKVAVVVSLGDKWRIRLFTGDDLEGVKQNSDTELLIKTRWFSDPTIVLPFDNPKSARQWLDRFKALQNP